MTDVPRVRVKSLSDEEIRRLIRATATRVIPYVMKGTTVRTGKFTIKDGVIHLE